MLAGAVLAFALVAHLTWSGMVAYAFQRFYDHRVPNLTKIPGGAKEWEPVLEAFWRANARRDAARPTVAFVGSSVTYGYPWQEPVIFSRVFARLAPQTNVVNLSYYSADIQGIRNHLFCPIANTPDWKPDVLVVEIPLVNSLNQMKPGKDPGRRPCAHSARGTGFFGYVALKPFGTGWVSVLWDEEAYYKPDEPIQIANAGPDYFTSSAKFAQVEEAYRRELAAFIDHASTLGKKVYVFMSPVHLPGVAQAGGDSVALARQVQVTWNVCESRTSVTCLSMARFGQERDLFYNITHFNQSGHRLFGEWLAREIATGQPSKPSQ